MPADLTTDEVDAAFKLCDVATEGPWEYRWGTLAGVHQPVLSCWIPQTKEDALFIAAARALLPRALATIVSLREENERLKKAATELCDVIAEYDDADLLALDNDPHPPSAIGAVADNLRAALENR